MSQVISQNGWSWSMGPRPRPRSRLVLSEIAMPGWLTILMLLLSPAAALAESPAEYQQMRKRLVNEVLAPQGITDPRVLDAMMNTPRHEFVGPAQRKSAYFDMSLPIGEHQTISSPFIVAYMTQSLDPKATDKVLEIGTGSGYQAAVLSPLVKEVYSIEIVELLGLQARATLKKLKYANVQTKIGDGFEGWQEHAPFNKIIVTCSPEKVPQPLIDQLAEGGMMVVPVGERYQQTLYIFRKENGKLSSAVLRPTLFVPMTGRAEDGRQVKPDPLHPKLINGGFESLATEGKYVPGWFYEQLAKVEMDSKAPEGRHYLTFRNTEPGRSSHILQGFAIDGSVIHELRVSAKVRLEGVKNVPNPPHVDMRPDIALSLYDANRKELGLVWVGPIRAVGGWQSVEKKFRIHPDTREAIIRLGLFGATGEVAYDQVSIEPVTTK
jgi:protein-L-isoaspartate(D-aspartate) O-methyltransferase